MRPRIIVVGNRVDIEEHGARNMRAEIIVRRQRQHAGHLEGSVDDFDFWIVDPAGKPIGCAERIVGGWRHAWSFQLLSWSGSSRPSTSFTLQDSKTWMPGTRPGMTDDG